MHPAALPRESKHDASETEQSQNKVPVGYGSDSWGCGSENTRVFHTRTFVFVCGSRAPVLHIISSLGQGVLGAREALLRPKIAVVAARCMAWSLG